MPEPAMRWQGAIATGPGFRFPPDGAEQLRARITGFRTVPGLVVRARDAGDGLEALVPEDTPADLRLVVEAVMWGFALGFRLGSVALRVTVTRCNDGWDWQASADGPAGRRTALAQSIDAALGGLVRTHPDEARVVVIVNDDVS